MSQIISSTNKNENEVKMFNTFWIEQAIFIYEEINDNDNINDNINHNYINVNNILILIIIVKMILLYKN